MSKKERSATARFKSYLKGEMEAASMYNALADVERDKKRAEMRHAAHWASKLEVATSQLKPTKPTLRIRIFTWLARRFGTRAVLPWLLRGEFADIRMYSKDPEAKPIVRDERIHARTLNELAGNGGTINILQSEGHHRASQAANIRAAVLGSNDGLVSNFALTMGVAGGMSDTNIIPLVGLAGLMAGAFSMAAGEYVSVRAQKDVYDREMEILRAQS
jgi:hypothetical protein